MWLIGNVGGCEYVFQGLDAYGYCMAGRCAACLSSSGDLVRVPDRMPCYSRMPPVPCAHMLSDAVHDLRTTRVRYQHGVVRMRLWRVMQPATEFWCHQMTYNCDLDTKWKFMNRVDFILNRLYLPQSRLGRGRPSSVGKG